MFRSASKNQHIQPFPYRVYLLTALALALAGLLVSVTLSISHYRVYTDLTYRSFCAISKAINCDTVSESAYSIFWSIPLAVWGAAGYAIFLLLLGFSASRSEDHQRVWSTCMVLAALFSLLSLLLAGVSTFKIGSYCILCIAMYGINFLLLYTSWLVRRRFHAGAVRAALVKDLRFLLLHRRLSAPLFALFGAGLLLTHLFFPAYWQFRMPSTSTIVSTGQTDEGHPWIGAERPALEIVEFTDYQCFQCRKMHYYLRELVAKYPDKIRLIHRNYPMDHEVNFIVQEPFHLGSGKMALLAIHAATVGRFWQMNDLLFDLAGNGKDIDLKEVSEKTGLDPHGLAGALQNPAFRQRLMIDIRTGMKLRVLGTPSYLINSNLYEGNIPAEILAPIIEGAAS
jgi:uncharacterized membrane protein/protein-disulfide isomerase